MAGRFEGVSDLEWRLFEDIFPPAPPKRSRGMPHAPFRKILNTLLYILITGCRWCDVPRGPQWASKSATHRWLQRWQADGTLAAMQARILGIAEERGMIRWEYGAVDGAFSPWEGGLSRVGFFQSGHYAHIVTLMQTSVARAAGDLK